MPKVVNVDRIFKATLQVFAERGYEAATTKEIAERAGVNEVTLYRRYNTKAELIRTALAQELGNSPFGHLTSSDDAQADIAMIVKAYIETFEVFGSVVLTLLGEAARHPEIQSATSALLPNLQNAAQVIARHQASGQITTGDPMLKLIKLIAPLAMIGSAPPPVLGLVGDMSLLDPEQIASEFLNGHLV